MQTKKNLPKYLGKKKTRKAFSFKTPLISMLSLVIVISGILIYTNVRAVPAITPASNGTGVSLDTSSAASSPSWTTLGNIILTEAANGEINTGVHTFSLPAGWEFNTSQNINIGSNAALSGIRYFPENIVPDASSFTFSVDTASSGGTTAVLSFGNIQVRPTGTTPSSGNITHTAGTITGVTNGTMNFGSLSTVPGVATHLKVSVDSGTINAGGTVNATVRAYDQFDNLVDSGSNNYTGAKNLTFYFNDSEVAAAHQSPNSSNPTTNGVNLGVASSVTFTNGVSASVAVVPVKMETVDIDVSDGSIDSTGDVAYDSSITVTPGNFDTFVIDLAGTATAGTATTTRLYAYDAYGNTTTKDEDGSDFTASESITFTSTATVAPDTTTKPTYNGNDLTDGEVVSVDLSAGWFTSDNFVFYNAGETPTVTAQHGTKSAVSAAINIAHATADHLQFSGAVGTQTAGTQFALPSLQAVDAYGNLADNSNGAAPYASTDTIAYTLSGTADGPTAGVDAYTTSVTFANGVSTTQLDTTLYRAQDTTITANSDNLAGTDEASASFTVDPASASSLAFTQQPAGSVSGVALTTQPKVTGYDPYGNIDTNFAETITLTVDTGSLSGDVDVAAVSGVATFADVAHTATADGETATLTANDQDGVATDIATVDASTFDTDVIATSLAFTQQPAAGANSGAVLGTQPIVTAQGPNNVTDTDFIEIITLTVDVGSLSGDVDIAAVAGVATFTDVVHTATDDNQVATLTADDVAGGAEGDLSTVNANTFTTLVIATKVIVATQPASIVSGVSMTQPIINYVDANDVVDVDIDADQITVSENGAGSVAGTLTVTASNGVATFSDLVYTALADQEAVTFTFTDDAGNAVDLSASPVNSNALNADVVATQIVITTQPASVVSGVSMTQPVLEYRDANNLVDTDIDADVVTITENGNGSVTSGATATASNGVVTFSGTIYSALADQESVTFTFTDDAGNAVDLSGSPVSSGALTAEVIATKVIVATQPASIVSGVSMTQPIINYVDANDVVDVDIDADQITVSENGAGSVAGTLTVTASNGVATFSDLVYSASADQEAVTFSFTDDAINAVDLSGSPVNSNALNANVVATQIVLTQAPADAGATNGNIISGVAFATQPALEYRDADNKVDTDIDTDVITITENGNGSVSAGATATASNGVATFSGTIYAANADQESVTFTFTDDAAGTVNLSAGPVSSAALTADVIATKLIVNTQPASLVSGISMTQPIIHYVDVNDVVDVDIDADQVTVSENGAGSVAGTLTVTASNGVATFTDLVYTALADQEAVTFTFDDDAGNAVNLASTVDSNQVNADVVATKFIIIDPTDGTVDNPITVTVQAQNADDVVDTGYTNDVTLNADGSATGDGLVDIASGVGTLDISDTVAETVNLSLTDSEGTGLTVTSTQDVVFNPGGLDTFTFAVIGAQTAGTGFTIDVTAKDQHGNTTTRDESGTLFDGTDSVTFTSTATASGDGTKPTYAGSDLTDGETVDVNLTTGSFTSGNFVLYNSGETPTITVTNGTKSGATAAITVNADSFAAYTVTTQNSGTENVDTPFTLTITPIDAYGNTQTTGATNGQIDFTTSATNSPDGDAPSFSAANESLDLSTGAKTTTVTVTLTNAGETPTVTATANSGGQNGTTAAVTVNPGAAANLRVTGTASVNAGDNNELTITAKDQYGNTATSYTGDKSLTFSGPTAAPAGNVATIEGTNVASATTVNFASGVTDGSNATLIAYNAETVEVDVTDGSIDSTGDAAYDLDLTVAPGNLESFNLINFSTLTAGTATTTVVTALDAYENPTTKDTDGSALAANESITFSSTATAAPDGTKPTYNGNDLTDDETVSVDISSGSFTTANIIYYKASETPTLTATLNSKSGVAASAGVDSAAISALGITGDSPITTAQTSNITVTGTDQYENPVTDNSTVVVINAGGGANLGSGGGTLSSGQFSTTLTKDTPGNSTVTASSGSLTPGNVTIVFTDGTAPTVDSWTPSDGTTGVSLSVNPTLIFSEYISSTTVNTTNIKLKKYSDSSDVTITLNQGNFDGNSNPKQVVLVPSAQLDYNTQYYIYQSGLTDVNSNALAAWDDSVSSKDSHEFTTEASETTPPTVVGWAPADDATDVQVGAQIWVKFSEALDPTTVTGANVQLRKYSDNSQVSATLSMADSNTKVVITPDSNLAYGTQYYFFIGSNVTDVVGNNFAASTWYQAQKDEHEFTTLNDLIVDSYVLEKGDAVKDDTFANGWRYRFDVTLNNPSENSLKVKFSDWIRTGGVETIAIDSNTRMLIDESSGGTINTIGGFTESLITSGSGDITSYTLGNDYADQAPGGADITGLDNNGSQSGRQITFYVFFKIPAASTDGSYTTSYGVLTE